MPEVGQNRLALLTRSITVECVTEKALLVSMHKQQAKWIPRSAIHKDHRDFDFKVGSQYTVRIRKWAC